MYPSRVHIYIKVQITKQKSVLPISLSCHTSDKLPSQMPNFIIIEPLNKIMD